MKKYFLTICFVFSLIPLLSQAQNANFEAYYQKTDAFFAQYVKNGRVDYKGIKANVSELNSIIDLSNTINIPANDKANYQAFWINNYNLGVMKLVVENYPINSPMAVPGFFKTKKIHIGGKKVTLEHIENKLLRKTHPDARYHFVLVCAAISCPPIAEYAYIPTILDQQLDKRTRMTINNPEFTKINPADNSVELSEIFKWYAEDFETNGQSFIDYINPYLTKKLPSNAKTSFYQYNWNLNEMKGNPVNGEKAVSNIRAFTPSKLLGKGVFDFKLFNNLYSHNKKTNKGSTVENLDFRESFFTTTLELSYGISKNARINVGAVVAYKNSIKNEGSVLDVFHYKNEDLTEKEGKGYFKRTGLSSITPLVKISPFKNLSNFSFQTGLVIPLFEEINYGFIDKRSYVWETKLFFDHSFARDKFQVFTELDVLYNFGENKADVPTGSNKNASERFANNSLFVPFSVFLSYFPNDKFTVYTNVQQSALIDVGNNFSQEFTQVGLGGKYQATAKLNIEISYGSFVRGSSFAGLGSAYNLGLRYIL
ncbi:MAG: DUF547 domain-containing protein [Flavobacteriales bacterium]|jgi:hypothetical protein|nr:DUF547 domain-containing protein [Flavobacteriales bacterium]